MYGHKIRTIIHIEYEGLLNQKVQLALMEWERKARKAQASC